MSHLACSLEPGRSLDQGVERVRLAESLGYDSVWVTHIAAREPLQLLGHYAHHTERIGLGTGVVPIVLRHPALMAMEAATLDEVSRGRLRLGIGVSHKVTVEGWYGQTIDDPVGRMREYATIVRDILERGRTELEGNHYTARFGFMGYGSPRQGIPILLAALGPNMLRLAAEVADGVILWMCNPAYIRETVRPVLLEALAEHGRDPNTFEVVAAVPVGLTENAEAARDVFRSRAFPYTQLPFYRKAIAAGGHQEDLGMVDGGGGVSDAFVDDYAGIGDPASVRAKIEEYRAAGVTLPSIGPLGRHPGSLGVEATLEAAIT
ncbi:MAG: LLM class flavin-dependent oxidoreductase [Actinomycetota bacterium]